MNDARWTVRVTSPPGRGSTVHARGHSFAAGAPVSFDQEHPSVTALEYLLGAVGAEIAGGLRELGRRRRVEVNEVEVVVHATLRDPMVYLRVVDHEGDPGIERIEVSAYVGSLDDEAAVRRLWEELIAVGPVLNTLGKAVRLDLSYRQVV